MSRWQDIFEYCGGCLYWRTRGPGRSQSKPAGSFRKDGYRAVEVDGKKHRVHRIIWEMHYGPIPQGMLIDHADANPQNNKIENLRLVDSQRNGTRSFSNSQTGWKGVQQAASGRYQAMLPLDSTNLALGVFADAEDAALVYNFVAAEWYGVYARFNKAEQTWLE